jgi:hypothetical protein
MPTFDLTPQQADFIQRYTSGGGCINTETIAKDDLAIFQELKALDYPLLPLFGRRHYVWIPVFGQPEATNYSQSKV